MIDAIPFNFYIAALPIFFVSLASLLILLLPSSLFKNQTLTFSLFSSVLLISLGLVLYTYKTDSFLNGALLFDSLSLFGQSILILTALIVTMLVKESYLSTRFFSREVCSLYLLTLLGMMVIVSSADLITLFVGLELSSIGIYILSGYIFPDRMSVEGALKYLVLGSFATAFLLFGLGLLYATTGILNLNEMSKMTLENEDIWLKISLIFTLVGVSFKLALFPFHKWAPDVYESAPTSITALMATSVKVIIVILIMRLGSGLSNVLEWSPIFLSLSALSMIGGNLLALIQTSMKRMLAFSSIAHSGYMAIALCILQVSDLSHEVILFYLVGYVLTSLLAFGTLISLETAQHRNIQLQDLQGLFKSSPLAAFSLSVAMFSFAGIPPTVGFFSKFFVFNAALQQNLYSLVLIGVLGSVISLYYYLRVLVTIYMQKPMSESSLLPFHKSFLTKTILCLACLFILLFGTVFPDYIYSSLRKEVVVNDHSH